MNMRGPGSENLLNRLFDSPVYKSPNVLLFGNTLGQGLQTSTYPGEVIFSICLAISGLILFALLIGNMQVNPFWPVFSGMLYFSIMLKENTGCHLFADISAITNNST